MKCLVTGSTGFIGSSLVKRLVEEGYNVRGLVHKTPPQYKDKKVEYVHGDITDFDSIKSWFKNVDFVFHCAALVKDYGSKEIINKVNIIGTKRIVEACEKHNIKRFIYLSHLKYESDKRFEYYSLSKIQAEKYLLNKYKTTVFPIVIIRPGNVYGPGATTWVLRPLKSIQKNRIALIDRGNGIFLHTYIDNLLDALIASMKKPGIVGKTIEVTDGDNSVTWGKYLNNLAMIAGEKPINRSMSKKTAFAFSHLMMILYKIFRIEPWVTPTAVQIFTNSTKVSIEKAEKLLDYKPRINYKEGMNRLEKWLKEENLI